MAEKETKTYDIIQKVKNKFLLSAAVAKRARQIKEGSKPLITVDLEEENPPILIALEEIRQNKLSISIQDKSVDEDLLSEINEFVDIDILDKEVEEEEKPKKDSKSKSKSKSLAA